VQHPLRDPSCGAQDIEEKKLAQWINNQKTAYKMEKLPEEQKKVLEEVGIQFIYREDRWNDAYARLQTFQVNNKRWPSDRSSDVSEKKIAVWVAGQKVSRRKGTLTEDKVAKLESIGITWEVFEEEWKRNIAQIGEFIDLNGRWPNQYSNNRTEAQLARWVETQRKQKRAGHLSANKITELENIQICWDVLEDMWNAGLQCLRSVLEQGKLPSHKPVTDEERRAFYWLAVQRRQFKKGKLEKTRIQILEELGIDLNPFHTKWDSNYEACKCFVSLHHHLPVTRAAESHESGLVNWINRQIQRWKSGNLSSEQICKLEEIGVQHDHRVSKWNDSYRALKDFIEQNGQPPSKSSRDATERKLAVWLISQRLLWNKGRLSPERIGYLEMLDIDMRGVVGRRKK